MTYNIEDIKNTIEWDGVNPPKVRHMNRNGYVKPCTENNRPGRTVYNLYDIRGKRVKVSRGRIIFMLRTGISLRQCIEHRVQVYDDGRLRDYLNEKRRFNLFATLSECKETLRIIEDLCNDDPSSFYALFFKERGFLRYSMFRLYGVGKERFDELYDEALERTEKKLRDFRFRYIRKIHCYFINEMVALHKKSKPFVEGCRKITDLNR